MKRSLFIVLILLLPAALIAQPAPLAKFTSGSQTKLAVDIDNNLILVKVRVNGSRPLKFIFDTGASMSGIDQRFVSELGLKTSDDVKGSGTGGSFGGSLVKGVTLAVDGAEVADQPVFAAPMNAPPGFEFDGVIGYDFIARFVVEIDYEAKTITLRDPRQYSYKGKGKIIPLDLTGRKTPLVRSSIKVGARAPFTANLELDSGADNAFLLNSPAVKKHGLLAAFKESIKSSGRGAGGEQDRIIVRVGRVGFGPFIIKNPPVALVLDKSGSGAATDNDGIIGGEVLRRFRVIIDYSRRQMILEPNKAFNEPYEDESGE